MDYEEAVKSLRAAMHGAGTDEAELIKAITKFTNKERQIIIEKYMTMYGKSLIDKIKSEISGHFLDATLGLLEPVIEFEAKALRKAMKGVGTDEKVLIQTLCPKTGDEIQELIQTYNKLFQRDLLKDIESECPKYLGRLLKLTAGRENDTKIDRELAKKEANELYQAGEGKLGTDEAEFIRILCTRSFSQLRATFEEYNKLSANGILKAIEKEMSGNFGKACMAIVKSCLNRPAYFAERLHKTMKGIGTDEESLIRLLITRAEIDLNQIKDEYVAIYGKSLFDDVSSDTSGDFRKLLLALIGE
ncbi:unnamed protein product [Brachionus calyciflorus]|uniref:Annexin n=1 Tax=Brachionus calyciflorus TaxID=104777 RepID=A0A814GY99_9BILA|nr:unnamed protein product [Brachionus calyciflorus]